MRTPPLLIGLTLAFWGWQAGLLPVALLMAAVLEGARLIHTRWKFADADFRRLWHLCTLLFLGATISAFLVNDGASGFATLFEDTSFASRSEALNKTTRSVLVLLQWLPMIFFPMAAAQAYSHEPTIDARIFSWLLRRERFVRATGLESPRLNVSHSYFALCLLAASATHRSTLWFYPGLCLLLAGALWHLRNRRFSAGSWFGVVGAGVLLGYLLQGGLVQMQRVVQNLDTAWLTRLSRQRPGDKGSRTAIGSIGRMKLSGRIVLRVDPGSEPVPPLLREASYSLFLSPFWYVGDKKYSSVLSEQDETTWNLGPEKLAGRSVRIAQYLPDGRGCLAAPQGIFQFEQLPVFLLKTNGMGVFKVDAGPGLVSYLARYRHGLSLDNPPTREDFELPNSEQPALRRIADELGLASLAPAQALETVRNFFRDRFVYSSDLRATADPRSRRTALADFLLQKRAGHCEYFATATVLLLRQAGLPARYAVGYAVTESSGKKYIVRERHAHAWCLVYQDGVWQDFDTTPPGWAALEAQQAPLWERLSDAWSTLWFQFSKWRWGKTGSRRFLLWLLVPPLVAVLAQLFFRKQWRRGHRARPGVAAPPSHPGQDSEFYLVEHQLLRRGHDRRPGEPLTHWLERIGPALGAGQRTLEQMLALHYRYRFDPLGLPEQDRLALRRSASSWLAGPASPFPLPASPGSTKLVG